MFPLIRLQIVIGDGYVPQHRLIAEEFPLIRLQIVIGDLSEHLEALAKLDIRFPLIRLQIVIGDFGDVI